MNFDDPFLIVVVLLALVATPFVFRIIKHRNFTAALYRSAIKDTLGEIAVASAGPRTVVLKVHTLSGCERDAVGLEIGTQAGTRYAFTPVTLSRQQADELAQMLQSAAVANAIR